MLPFLKNKEASVSAPIEHVEFGKEEGGEESFGMLDAVAEDILSAIKNSDKQMLKSALESLVEHMKSESEPQEEMGV